MIIVIVGGVGILSIAIFCIYIYLSFFRPIRKKEEGFKYVFIKEEGTSTVIPSIEQALPDDLWVNKVFQKPFRKLPIESYLLKCITDVDDSAVLETYCKNQFDVHFSFYKAYIIC